MKILRVRRGFTTNSSASSEWVAPRWEQQLLGPKVQSGTSPSGTSPSGSSSGTSQTASPSASTATQAAAGQGATSTLAAAPAAQSGSGGLAGNGAILGLLALGIVLAFAAERLFRGLMRRRRVQGQGGETDDD